jgi:DNA-binding LytR/AlgR family response regulator
MLLNYNDIKRDHKFFLLLAVVLATCVAFTIFLDLAGSKLEHTSFYLSESLLFSSFWWIFLPLLYVQFSLAKVYKTTVSQILLLLIPAALHLFAYPALVWLISKLFYYHTFPYLQTFTYELTSYSFMLLFVYSVPFTLYTFFTKRVQAKPDVTDTQELPNQDNILSTLVVTDGNKKITICINDILYFSANSPYINIHHKHKRYLHNETLKSMVQKLDSKLFIKVHKSTIVNIIKVQSYQSRLNGDYDLTMIDGTEVRLSRNYASAFKQKLKEGHQDTAKQHRLTTV